jgi:hypothetical protein
MRACDGERCFHGIGGPGGRAEGPDGSGGPVHDAGIRLDDALFGAEPRPALNRALSSSETTAVTSAPKAPPPRSNTAQPAANAVLRPTSSRPRAPSSRRRSNVPAPPWTSNAGATRWPDSWTNAGDDVIRTVCTSPGVMRKWSKLAGGREKPVRPRSAYRPLPRVLQFLDGCRHLEKVSGTITDHLINVNANVIATTVPRRPGRAESSARGLQDAQGQKRTAPMRPEARCWWRSASCQPKPGEQPKMRERSRRARPAPVSKVSGFGLGLTFVQCWVLKGFRKRSLSGHCLACIRCER